MIADAVAWLCRSPRRLFLSAVAVLVLIVVGGSALFGHGSSGAGKTARSSSARPAASATAAIQAQVPDAAPAVTAAVGFVKLWATLKPGETPAQWHSALAPLATPLLGRTLQTTDPARLPNATPAGEPVVQDLGQTSALIAVPLSDGSSVLVTVVPGDAGQLVSDIEPDAGDN